MFKNSEKNICLAGNKANGYEAVFIKDDCCTANLKEEADLALCFYDVGGSFVNPEDNIVIIQNSYRHLKSEGPLVMSVMNLELTSFLTTNNVPNIQKNLEALPI